MKQRVSVSFCSADYSPLNTGGKKPRKNRWPILWKFTIVLVVLCFLVCLGIFVILPITFMLSRDFQASMVLPRWKTQPGNFTDFKRYGLEGVRNFYVTLKNNITLGVWHILPEKFINISKNASSDTFETLLYNSSFPVLLFFHGNARIRTDSSDLHKIQRKYFHVITFDYRGYGDSTQAEMSETGLTTDSTLFYLWLEKHTKSEIFVWGHSIGTGVSTITLAKLQQKGIQPKGLFLETPFTSSRDVTINSKLAKFFSWLPYFENTILDPLEQNDLSFNVTKYITQITCPIMFLHAQDDDVIPYELGKKLYEVALKSRNDRKNLKFYTFEKELKYGHAWICKDPRLSNFIRTFMQLCDSKKKEAVVLLDK